MVEDGVTIDESTAKGKRQREAVTVMERVAKALNLKVYFYESTEADRAGSGEKASNGWYDSTDGSIHLDLNAGDNAEGYVLFTASHELSHFIRDWSPAKYQKLLDFLVENYGGDTLAELTERQMQKQRASGQKVNKMVAQEEVFCDTFERMLTDERVLEKLESLKAAEPTLIEKIRDFFRRLANSLRRDYSEENRQTKGLVFDIADRFDEFADMFAEAAVEAGENFGKAAENDYDVSEKRYSERNFVEDKYFSRQIDNHKELKEGGYVKVGNIIKGSPLNRIGIPDKTLFFDNSKIIKEMLKRGDNIPKDVMKQIPKILDNPIVITEFVDKESIHSANVYGNIYIGSSPVVVGIMVVDTQRGVTVNKVQTVHPNRHFMDDMTDDNILYLSENKKETKAWFQALGTQKLPLGGTKFGFIRIISQTDRESQVKKSTRNTVDSEGNSLSEQQAEYFKDSKIRDENGNLRVVYHGTNTGDFTVFDPKYIGMSSGDDGFFGKGFYFSYSRGEAAYYGAKRIIESYLDIKNPFDFEKNFQMYDGNKTGQGYAHDAIQFMNFSKLFPEIAKNITIDVVEKGSNEYKAIGIIDFSKELEAAIKDTHFEVQKVKSNYGEEWVALADKFTKEYVDRNGVKREFTDYRYKQNFYSEKDARDQLFNAYNYLEKVKYSSIDMYSFTRLILDNNDEFTEALKRKGYDGTIQSEYGDEAVAFYPEQIKSIDNKAPTENQDIRYSSRNGTYKEKHSLSGSSSDYSTMSYDEIFAEQQKLYQREISLMDKKREAEKNPDLLQAMDDYQNLFSELKELLSKKRGGTATPSELSRIDEIKSIRDDYINRVADIQERIGLNSIAAEEKDIRETKEELRKASDAAYEREGKEKENKAIKKSGLTSQEYFRKKALKAFKTTNNFNEAGYLLPDGKLLNFSGGERNHRYRDHREIGEIYEATSGTKALNRFLSDGNIRIMAESPGIDLAAGVEPTKEQYSEIRRFINTNGTKDGMFYVDFSGEDGSRAGNYSYNDRVSADRIISDIKYFYDNGETREQSITSVFHSYSTRNRSDSYRYDTLIKKDDMPIATLSSVEGMSRKDVISAAKKNAVKFGGYDSNGSLYVNVPDISRNVIISSDGLKHGFDRRFSELGSVSLHAGEILHNSILINELTPKKENAIGSYLLLGIAKDNDNLYIVRFVVNQFNNSLEKIDVLYAIDAKKESAALNAPRSTVKQLSATDSYVSISKFLDYVNKYYPSVLPEDVLKHYGYARRPDGIFDDDILFSTRNARYLELAKDPEKNRAELQSMVDEAAKEAGYTVKAYHGTPNGTFHVFRDWSYFTKSKNYAERYTQQGASTNYKKEANKPTIYEVYIKANKPFDTRKEKERNIFLKEFYRQWGNGAPLGNKGLPDWTDGDDFIEFFDENGYDYDEILLDEGGDGGYGDSVTDRGISYVVKNSAQVKSADPVTYDDNGNVIPLDERFDTENQDIRYSLRNGAKEEIHKAITDVKYRNEIVISDGTPSIITSQRGAKNLPLSVKPSHVRENVYTEKEAMKLGLPTGTNYHYHGLGEPLYVSVLEELDEITEAYRGTKNAEDPSRRENYFILISKQKDDKGNTINVPVFINEVGVFNRVFVPVNKIATVFGRDSIRDYINREVKKRKHCQNKKQKSQSQ